MATWKKVVVSGSNPEFQTLSVDSTATFLNADTFQFTGSLRLSGSAIITGSVSISGSLFATASNAITASHAITASYALNAIASSFPLTNGEGISTFTFNGSSAQSVAVSGAADLTQNIITKWDNVSNKFANSSLTDNGTTISGTTSIVLTGANSSLSGSLFGTSSWATTASIASSSLVTDTTTGTGPFYLTFVDGTTGNRGLRVDSATLTFNATTNLLTVTSSNALSSSVAASASIAEKVTNALTLGDGLTGAAYNGSTAITAAVGAGALISVSADAVQVATSSLTTNQIPKLGTNTLAGSNITDTGTQVQIGSGASSGLTVAAGGVTVTGNSTFNNNLTVAGDLTVAGTASFQNTQNLLIGDRFAALASGSTSLTDGGIIVVSATGAGGMSGSAWFLESTNTSTYGRFATAFNVHVSASSIAADEYAVTTKITAANPSAAPTWGGTTTGQGNMWVNSSTEEIFIYS